MQGLETSPKLSPTLLTPVHNLILQVRQNQHSHYACYILIESMYPQTNFHPVKLALFLDEDELLKAELQQVAKAINFLVQREMHKVIYLPN